MPEERIQAEIPETRRNSPERARVESSSVEPPASSRPGGSLPRGASGGAVVAVLTTVFGGVAMTAVFGSAVAAAIGGVAPPPPPRDEGASVNVKWEENEGSNSSGSARFQCAIVGQLEDYLVLEAARRDLGFDRIRADAEGWPPDHARWNEFGLKSYEISVTLSTGDGGLRAAPASEIVRTDSSDRFYVLVPRHPEDRPRPPFSGPMSLRFSADAGGVVELAKSEVSDGAQ